MHIYIFIYTHIYIYIYISAHESDLVTNESVYLFKSTVPFAKSFSLSSSRQAPSSPISPPKSPISPLKSLYLSQKSSI